MTAALARGRWRVVALGTAVVVAGGALTGATATAQPAKTTSKPALAKAARVSAVSGVVSSSTVTLPTGDRFRVDMAADGSQQASPLPAKGGNGRDRSGGTFAQYTLAGDTYVIPAEAAPYIGRTLDARLFNVSYLVRAKLDDKHAKSLPVRVKASEAKAEALPATSVTSASEGTAKAKIAKEDAAGFGELLAKRWRDARDEGAALGSLPGVDRIELVAPDGAPKLPPDPSAAAPLAAKAAQSGTKYHNLTFKSIDLDGNPGVVIGLVHNVDHAWRGSFFLGYPAGLGTTTISVPEGTYSFGMSVFTGPADDLSSRAALVIEPEVGVTGDTTVTLDARKAVPYKAGLADPAKPDMVRTDFMTFMRTNDSGGDPVGFPGTGELGLVAFFIMRLGSGSYNGQPNLYATPTRPVSKGKLHFVGLTHLTEGTPDAIGPAPTYKMVFPAEGAVPATLTHTVARSQMAAVRSRLHATASDTDPTGSSYLRSYAYLPWTQIDMGEPGTVPAGDRVDYLYSSAPDQVLWEQVYDPESGNWMYGPRRTLRPGQVVDTEWNGGPDVPSPASQYTEIATFGTIDTADTYVSNAGAQVCVACRQGNLGMLYLRGGGDEDLQHYAVTFDGRTRFYRNGELAYDSDVEINGLRMSPTTLPLLPRPADYRLTWDYRDPDTPSAVSSTDWRFRSGPGDPAANLPEHTACSPDVDSACAFLPLLFVNYDLELDATSRAAAGQPFDIGFRVSHQEYQPAPTGVTATVEVSYDDGDTWSQPVAATARADGAFHASITHPAYSDANRWVSLRVTARDGAGNAVTQTNIHAYRLDG